MHNESLEIINIFNLSSFVYVNICTFAEMLTGLSVTKTLPISLESCVGKLMFLFTEIIFQDFCPINYYTESNTISNGVVVKQPIHIIGYLCIVVT